MSDPKVDPSSFDPKDFQVGDSVTAGPPGGSFQGKVSRVTTKGCYVFPEFDPAGGPDVAEWFPYKWLKRHDPNKQTKTKNPPTSRRIGGAQVGGFR